MSDTDNAKRAVCRGCRTRYNTKAIAPGRPFGCKYCGQVIYAPGESESDLPEDGHKKFGELAVEMGFITAEQLNSVQSLDPKRVPGGSRIGDLLVRRALIRPKQAQKIVSNSEGRVKHFIPGYDIVDKLGEGGMGAVYKGVHLISGKTVAIKVLSSRLSTRDVFLERFHREARVAIDLDHPNIVKGFDEGNFGSTHYFVMEYVHGKSVKRIIRRQGAIGERNAVKIIKQIAYALEYAHSRSIVHRDIKPDNIMLNREGGAKLADYGLVKYLDNLDAAGLTAEGQIMGTPNYISPEQASGKTNIDIRSDIYSLGATFYNFITGQTPYKGDSQSEILCKHVSDPTPDPRDVNPGLTESVCRLVMKMMSKDPAERYQNPSELVEALNQCNTSKTSVPPQELLESNRITDVTSPGGLSVPSTEHWLEEDEEAESEMRLAPILFGIGALALAAGVIVAVSLSINSAKSEPEKSGAGSVTAEELGTTTLSSGRLLDSGSGKKPVLESSVEELKAGEIYKNALTQDETNKLAMLREIVMRFPTSQAAKLAMPEIKKAEEKEKRLQKQARKREKQERERLSIRAYTRALGLSGGRPQYFKKALKDVIEDFPGSAGATKAQREIALLDKRLRAEKVKELEKIVEEKQKEEEEKKLDRIKDIERVRFRFFDLYRSALRKMDYEAAKKYSSLLAKDTRYPELNELGRNCEKDMETLSLFYPSICESILAAGEEEQSLIFSSGKETVARVLYIQDNIMNMLVAEVVPIKRPVWDLAEKEQIRFFRESYKERKPFEGVVIALYYFARGNYDKAKEIFNICKSKDPLHQHHTKLFELMPEK